MIGGLTKNEITILLKGLTKRNQVNRENYEAVIGWAEGAKLDSDLLVLVFMGYIDIGVAKDGHLQFEPTDLGLASPRKAELERMGA